MKLAQKYKYVLRGADKPDDFCDNKNITDLAKVKFLQFLDYCESGLIIKDRKNSLLKTFQIHKWKGNKSGLLGAKLAYDIRIAFKIDTISEIKKDEDIELREYIITIVDAGTHRQLKTEGSLNV